MSATFEGLKVLELSVAGIGPFTGKFLGDFGATVIRMESLVHPDVVRLSPPYKEGVPRINASAFWTQNNSSKFDIGVNLKNPKGRQIALKLIEWCDVFVENFAPGVVDRLGLSYAEVTKANPGTIMLSYSNLGRTGPCAMQPGLGTNLQALSGLVHLLGWEDRGPDNPFGAIPDRMAPPFALALIIGAIDYKKRTGKGQYVDVSQFEVSCQIVSPLLLDSAINKRDAMRRGNRDPNAAPHGVFPCLGEEQWCAIAVFTDDDFRRFCQVSGQEHLIDDRRFATLEARKANEDELDRLVSTWTKTMAAESVMTNLQEAGVAAGAVRTPADLFGDSQLLHRQHFRLVDHSEIGPHHVPGQPSLLSESPADIKPAPTFGEHNERVVKGILNMSEREYAELVTNRVLEFP